MGIDYLCVVDQELLPYFNPKVQALKDQKILLAHSGGVDSAVLAHLFLTHALSFSVAHCNFQLRGDESEEGARFVEDWCAHHKVPFYSVRFTLDNYPQKNTQLAARELRYQWFEALKEVFGFTAVCTAHHLNDQLETFLMHSLRGTGLDGMVGIPDTETLQRPLLGITKAQLLDYAHSHKLAWREDSSNATTHYTRNALRHTVIPPLLEALPKGLEGFSKTVLHLQESQAFQASALSTLQSTLFEEVKEGIQIPIQELMALPHLLFCLHHWFSPYGFKATEVLKLCKASSGKRCVSTSHQLTRERTHLWLSPLTKTETNSIPITLEAGFIATPIQLSWQALDQMPKSPLSAHQAALNNKVLNSPLFLRKMEKGDYFYPTGMTGKKLLSKYFKDQKYTAREKEQQWLLCTSEGIVWVVGQRCDRRFAADAKTEDILLLTLNEK